MGAVVLSVRTTLDPFVRVPTTLRCSTKCCWSSFRLPLFAVALSFFYLAKFHAASHSPDRELTS